MLSLGDLFKDNKDGPKNVKFPEKLLKVLEQRLENIAMGKDAVYVLFLFLSLSFLVVVGAWCPWMAGTWVLCLYPYGKGIFESWLKVARNSGHCHSGEFNAMMPDRVSALSALSPLHVALTSGWDSELNLF